MDDETRAFQKKHFEGCLQLFITMMSSVMDKKFYDDNDNLSLRDVEFRWEGGTNGKGDQVRRLHLSLIVEGHGKGDIPETTPTAK